MAILADNSKCRKSKKKVCLGGLDKVRKKYEKSTLAEIVKIQSTIKVHKKYEKRGGAPLFVLLSYFFRTLDFDNFREHTFFVLVSYFVQASQTYFFCTLNYLPE